MKIVQAFPNKQDNTHCLRSSVKSILSFYLPDRKFTELEIDKNTGYHKGYFSWMPQTVIWLNELGLKAKLFSPADYKEIGIRGLAYLKELKKDGIFEIEQQRGEYRYITEIQQAAQEMIRLNLWVNKLLSVQELETHLLDEDTLTICKTVYEWLDDKYIAGISHYVVVVKKYSPLTWIIQDPGLPKIQDRKVKQYINNHSIFGDIILIRGLKESQKTL